MYQKIAGMTGTAMTEEDEFKAIYGLDVVEIPTNKPIQRLDKPDIIYRTEAGKFNAVVEDIAQRHANGQPVLVGTVSIEKSEQLSALLHKRQIPHNVLNAKYHEKEAEIIAQAGKFGAVTIATNMAAAARILCWAATRNLCCAKSRCATRSGNGLCWKNSNIWNATRMRLRPTGKRCWTQAA